MAQTIGYEFADTPIGRLLVSATPRGIASVEWNAEDAELLAALEGRFPDARLVPRANDAVRLARAIESVVRHPETSVETIPLDLTGTAFQRRVWEALRAIPSGTTRTYGDIAEAIGQPRAARAVGHACAVNPAPVVVPCHRVVGAHGLGGFSGGLPRKRSMLEREAAPFDE